MSGTYRSLGDRRCDPAITVALCILIYTPNEILRFTSTGRPSETLRILLLTRCIVFSNRWNFSREACAVIFGLAPVIGSLLAEIIGIDCRGSVSHELDCYAAEVSQFSGRSYDLPNLWCRAEGTRPSVYGPADSAAWAWDIR